MIKRIELYGPEGAGKTTIYEKLSALRNKLSPEFLLIGEARSRAVEAIAGNYDHDWLGLEGFFDRDIFQSESFQQRYLPAIKRRLLLINHLNHTGYHNAVLEDEGLLQRGINVAKAGEMDHDLICEYYNKVVLPSGIVVVSCDIHELLIRNAARGLNDKRLNRGKGAELSIKIVQIAEKVLAGRGVRILRLNSSTEVERNAVKAFNFIVSFNDDAG